VAQKIRETVDQLRARKLAERQAKEQQAEQERIEREQQRQAAEQEKLRQAEQRRQQQEAKEAAERERVEREQQRQAEEQEKLRQAEQRRQQQAAEEARRKQQELDRQRQEQLQQEAARNQQQATQQELSSEATRGDYTRLEALLKAGKWKEADQETAQQMCQVMGRQKEGWLRVEDIEQFPCADLRAIDQLWVKHSNGKFGFSVQKKIWQQCGSPTTYNKQWEKFGEKVGWRTKGVLGMGAEWKDYSEVTFDTSAPEGHLPNWGFGKGCGLWWGCGVSLLSREDV